MLKSKNILVGVTGSIAAYKTASLIRLLVKAEANVKVIMTPSAVDFITPLTLSTLSKNPVIIQLAEDHSWANHVQLGRWADLMVIAPLSCNTLAKMAQGSCDNLLMAVYLSATCKVMVAPAMDEDMWHHPATQKNLAEIESYGNIVLPVESGELASGLIGAGRMAEPETIFQAIRDFFFSSLKLKGKSALVTAGPTYEPIDPVRFIGNHSSGKMGIAIARVLAEQGAEVTLILGPSAESVGSYDNIQTIRVQTAAEMFDAAVNAFDKSSIAILSAAVADYTPESVSVNKIKKKEEYFELALTKTKDILGYLGSHKRADQVLIGFALETDNEQENALGKLRNKHADMIVLNSLNDAGAGFGHNSNKITIFDKAGHTHLFETKSKKEVATDIVNTIIKLFYE